MLLESKSKQKTFFRHALVATIASLLAYGVWSANPTWSPDMRLWKSFGGAGFALLWFTVFIGPAARLWSPAARLVSWRRETGIWFAITALVHGYLILDGWARWSAWRFLGYQYIPELETYLRSEPGFGLANLMGLTALVFALVLAATSSDKAVNYLGISSWKWLHTFAYVIFYLSALHVMYFAFIHYTPSPERVLRGLPIDYPANKLRFLYLGAFLTVFLAQAAAFIAAVKKQRAYAGSGEQKIQKTRTTVRYVKKVAAGTFEVCLVRPKSFAFRAGQHIRLTLPKLAYADPKGVSRIFSLCSSPYDTKSLCVAFRDTGSGYKKTLLGMKPGSAVVLEGPYGHFVLPEKDGKKHVFIAGGIGITPFISMIMEASGKRPHPDITLLYANRTEESAAFLKELKYLSDSSPRVSFHPVTGRLGADDIRKRVGGADDVLWWIVGPPGMVASVTRTLKSMGVKDDDIRTEEFAGY